ncbi:hypothetical protein HELRODRAFT_164692 [Helobdella robusta]|uniref:Muscleblind-like CCCH zinc finger domain-containing protein n=1 Tax=Helobdella robusta TaxID=6412 RepID=T1EVQ4_HELRO|nr:hypothetical protein HELRODRAFT_164692 [Helobdella robusta]ESN92617.1 hypothetical protein HELRODRAFT_164692 [Helobdella robusta]
MIQKYKEIQRNTKKYKKHKEIQIKSKLTEPSVQCKMTGKCQRKDPPCKYLHPPQHLKEQLLQNGRNNLAFKQQQTQSFNKTLQLYLQQQQQHHLQLHQHHLQLQQQQLLQQQQQQLQQQPQHFVNASYVIPVVYDVNYNQILANRITESNYSVGKCTKTFEIKNST